MDQNALAVPTVPTALMSPPRIKGVPFLGNLPDMARDPLELFTRAAREGDVVRLKIVLPAYLLNDPRYIRYVLQEMRENYVKPERISILKPLVGDSLLTSEGDSWMRQRRLAQPAFHRQRLAALADLMTSATSDMLDRWERADYSGRPVDMSAEMMRLTLRIAGQTLFGVDLDGTAKDIGAALTVALTIVNARFNRPFVLPWFFRRENRRFRQALATLDGLVYAIIRERRASGDDRGDLLSMFMAARDADTGETMNDTQLRDEVMTMILAGHETTAVALTWALYLLDCHPEVADALRAKLTAEFEDRRPGIADLAKVPELGAVVQEALRLYPPAWVFARTPLADDVVGGYRIRAGSIVFISPWVTHRDARFWGPEPDRFAPLRFLGEYRREAFIPFASGPRQCIGNNFALMEMQLVLAMLVRRFKVRLVPGHRVEPEPLLTLRPKGGMPMTLERV